jgi:hypothetical protein
LATLSLGAASSHAFALIEPAQWDERRARNREGYLRRYGSIPDEMPAVVAETDEQVASRFATVRSAFDRLRTAIVAAQLDTLILVGDDQNEHFTEGAPQIGIYTGGPYASDRTVEPSATTTADPRLAVHILETCVANDVDMMPITKFAGDRLIAHAFGPVLRIVDPESRLAVIPIFVNAIHMPATSGARCVYLGETIRRAIDSFPQARRVGIYASGGLSHFTAGFPWNHYDGPHRHGSIDEAFDRWLVDRLAAGDRATLARLSSNDLLNHGDVEFRSWLVAMGALGDVKPDWVVYEPFYRAIMGIGVALWSVDTAAVAQ